MHRAGAFLAILATAIVGESCRSEQYDPEGYASVRIDSNQSVYMDLRGPDYQLRRRESFKSLAGPKSLVGHRFDVATAMPPIDRRWNSLDPDEDNYLAYPTRSFRMAQGVPAAAILSGIELLMERLGFAWLEVGLLSDPDAVFTLSFSWNMMYGGGHPISWHFEVPRHLDGRSFKTPERLDGAADEYEGAPLLRLDVPVAPESRALRYRIGAIDSKTLERYRIPPFVAPEAEFGSIGEALAALPKSLVRSVLFLLELDPACDSGDFWRTLVALSEGGAQFVTILELEPRHAPESIELRFADADGSSRWYRRYQEEH